VPAEREAWAILASVHGLGPTTFELLLREHGTAAAVLALATSAAGRRRIRDGPGRDRVRLPKAMVDAVGVAAQDPEAVLARLAASDVAFVTVHDAGYPARLRRIEEPPPVLFIRGTLAALDREHAVAVVGTRRPTEAGRRIAARIADGLGSVGAVVVSGLAVGVDGAAHAAAVAAGRATVAVLGSGHDRLYPKAHRRLASAILETGGAIVSELAPEAGPTVGTFPRRNRLISGLADASVVVEAAPGSGALITARWALEQGRGCFVVPGSIDAPQSAGCLDLLRSYPAEVRVVTGIAELLDDLALVEPDNPGRSTGEAGPSRAAVLALLGRSERAVAGALTEGATSVDELAERTGLAVSSVLGTLTLLEIRGLVTGAFGRYRAAGVLAGAPPGLP
jgi:DNA processing protein